MLGGFVSGILNGVKSVFVDIPVREVEYEYRSRQITAAIACIASAAFSVFAFNLMAGGAPIIGCVLFLIGVSSLCATFRVWSVYKQNADLMHGIRRYQF